MAIEPILAAVEQHPGAASAVAAAGGGAVVYVLRWLSELFRGKWGADQHTIETMTQALVGRLVGENGDTGPLKEIQNQLATVAKQLIRAAEERKAAAGERHEMSQRLGVLEQRVDGLKCVGGDCDDPPVYGSDRDLGETAPAEGDDGT